MIIDEFDLIDLETLVQKGRWILHGRYSIEACTAGLLCVFWLQLDLIRLSERLESSYDFP